MKNLDEVKQRLMEIRDNGYEKTHRKDDTGIGKTLEDLLHIEENNISLPDIGDIELKSQRIDTGSMLTIATKAPKPRGANRRLFDAYKYLDRDGDYGLHSTSYGSRPNTQGFQLILAQDKLILDNPKRIEAYWPISVFDDVLKSKSDKILLVFAETRGERKTTNEQFHYIEAYLLSGLDDSKFEAAIANNHLKVDTRIGVYKSGKYKGKYHDHGTGFRISKANFLKLYDSYQRSL